MFARRDHFEAVGGWDERLFASEEVELAKALKRRGRFALLRTRVVTSGRKLRTYSGRRIFGTLLSLMVRGPKSVRGRELLGIWYDPRPPDPHRVRTLLDAGDCPRCGYALEGLERQADGCIVCPECGSAWNWLRVGPFDR